MIEVGKKHSPENSVSLAALSEWFESGRLLPSGKGALSRAAVEPVGVEPVGAEPGPTN